MKYNEANDESTDLDENYSNQLSQACFSAFRWSVAHGATPFNIIRDMCCLVHFLIVAEFWIRAVSYSTTLRASCLEDLYRVFTAPLYAHYDESANLSSWAKYLRSAGWRPATAG